jgi:hypothetical protein
MARYASDNRLNLRVGVSSFSKDLTSLEVIGRLGINSAISKNELDVVGSTNITNGLSVGGLSTFTGVGTFGSDLYVGGDLYVKDDVVFDEISATNLNITGFATVGSLKVTTDTEIDRNLLVAGVSTLTGIVTTGTDLYVGGDLYIKDDIVFDEVTGNNLNISGVATIGTLGVTGLTTTTDLTVFRYTETVGITTLSSDGGITTTGGDLFVGGNLFFGGNGGQLVAENLNVTGVTTLNTLGVSGATTTKDLLVTGVSTLTGIVTTGTDLYVGGNLFIKNNITFDEVDGTNLLVTGVGTIGALGVPGLTTTRDLTVFRHTETVGLTTLASAGGITTTGGDLFVGGNLYFGGDGGQLEAENLLVSGVATIGTLGVTGLTTTKDLTVYGNTETVGITTLASAGGITTTGGDFFVGGTFSIENLIITPAGITVDRLNVTGVGTINELITTGITSLATNGGITTTGGDLYVGGDLFIKDDIVFDEVTGTNLNISGVATIGTELDVNGITNLQDTLVSGAITATTFTGAGTGLTGITSATNATTIYGGGAGQLLYQETPGVTKFFENGSTNLVLASRGAGNPPQWVAAAPAGAIEGILLFDEGTQVGGGVTYAGIDFRGPDLIIEGENNGGIATVTYTRQAYVDKAGVSTSVVGGAASVTSLNVDVGITSIADFKITSFVGGGATVGCSSGISTYYGTGIELSGIVTSITAGDNISIDQSTGNVTITGLANTANVRADTLVVTGVSTLGFTTLGVTTISTLGVSGLTTTTDLLVTGISTLTGIVTTGTDLYVGGNLFIKDNITFDEVDGTNLFITGIGTFGNLAVAGLATTKDLLVTGISTLTGIVTTGTDLYVGGNLFIKDNITFDEVDGTNLFITGVGTFGSLEVTGLSTLTDLYVTGLSTFKGQVTAADINASGVITATSYDGSGINLTGIVTSIQAGDNISIDQSTGEVTITGLANTANVSTNTLNVIGVSTFGNQITATDINATGVVTATSFVGNGIDMTGIVTTITAGDNISIDQSTGNVTITGLANTANVKTNTLVVTGVSTLGIVTGAESIGVVTVYANNFVGGNFTGVAATFSGNVTIGGTLTYEDVTNVDAVGFVTAQQGINVGGGQVTNPPTTDYSEVTLTNFTPSSFNETYERQTSGFVLDTGTVASGNALFKSDSNYYYYVATGGGFNTGRIIIYSEEDSAWVALLNIGEDYTEGNVTDNEAVGTVAGSTTVTANSETGDGRNVPQASSDIVYATSGGGTSTAGIAITFLANGSGVFTGIVTVGGDFNVGSASSQFTVQQTATDVKVGIGTTDPNYNLDVRGTANVEGKLTVNENTVPSLAMVIALGGF